MRGRASLDECSWCDELLEKCGCFPLENQVDVTNLSIKVFKNVSDNDKAPQFRGIITDPTNEYKTVAEVSLWYADDKATGEQKLDANGNPFLTGKTKEPYVKKAKAGK